MHLFAYTHEGIADLNAYGASVNEEARAKAKEVEAYIEALGEDAASCCDEIQDEMTEMEAYLESRTEEASKDPNVFKFVDFQIFSHARATLRMHVLDTQLKALKAMASKVVKQ